MGNIHKKLDEDNFNNSKYIEVLNKELGCDNFRKNYPKEFEIMLDIFQKFIELYNCFFADSNGENIYRIKKVFYRKFSLRHMPILLILRLN